MSSCSPVIPVWFTPGCRTSNANPGRSSAVRATAMIQRPFYYVALGADPTNADVVYAGAEGFFKSTDGGKTFTIFRTPHGDNHDIWINPKDGNIMIQSNDGGANVSFDGGRTWSTQLNQPTAEIYGVWLDNQFPYKLYGAQQDNTTIIISSQPDGTGREDWRTGPGCETGPIMPNPRDPNIVYGSCKGQYGVMNLKVGQEKNYWVVGQSLYGNPASDLIYRFQRVSPMATSPHDADVLYYGSQYLHRTRDKGVTWEKISPDLTAHPSCCQGASGEPITRDVTGEEFYSTLYAIAESPLEKGVIWVGSNDGPFHVTRNNGKTWTDVTPKGLLPGGRVQYIEPSPHRRGSAYYAVYRWLLGDYQPYIYRNALIVSTQGRAFWILDNISSLHQLTPQVSTADAHLFKPRDGYRTRVNPTALGPTIEYYLPSAPNGAVTVEILDAKGAVINSYNSDAPATTGRGGRGGGAGAGEAQTEDPDAAPSGRRFGPPPPRVTKLAGLNRVTWDVRNKEGVTLPPGQYQARLKVGDQTSIESF